MPDERERRIARNEARFRDINNRLGEDVRAVTAAGEEVAFVCECGSATCSQRIPLELDEYARVRTDPLYFVVVPGHEIPDAEDVAERHETFNVVRKPAYIVNELT